MNISNKADGLPSLAEESHRAGDLPEQIQRSNLLDRFESLPFLGYHIRARLVMGMATFFDAFDVLALAYVLPTLIGLWHLKPADIGLLIGAGFAGQLIGALFFGALAERIGRLKAVTYSVLILSSMSLMCAFAWSFSALLVFRFIQGIGLGGEVPVASTYINEYTRAHGRGRFFLLYELVFAAGLVVAAVAGALLVPRLGWQSMFYVGTLPIILAFVIPTVLKESPRWLISKNRFAEAEKIISSFEASLTPAQAATMRLNMAGLTRIDVVARQSNWRELFYSVYRGRTFLVWGLWICTFLTSYGLTIWLPSIYRTVYGLSVSEALWAGVVTNLVGLPVAALCALLVDKIGRRAWFIMAFVAGSIPLLALASMPHAGTTTVIVLASISFMFVGANSILLYLYTAEIYPTRIRAIGIGIASAWLRIASAGGPVVIGFTLGKWGVSAVFGLFGIIAMLGAIVAFKAIETKERRLEEIAP